MPTAVMVPQHLSALEVANRVRLARADVKHQLKAGERPLVAVFDDDAIATMRLADLLVCLPRVGRQRAARVCRAVRVSESRPVAGVTARERAAILTELAL